MIRVGKQSATKQSTFENRKANWVLGVRTVSEMMPEQALKMLIREMKRKGTYIRFDFKPNQISLCRQRPLNGRLNKQIWFVFEGKNKEMSRLILKAKETLAPKIGCVHVGAIKAAKAIEGIDNFPPKIKGWKLYGGGYGVPSWKPSGWIFHSGDIVQGMTPRSLGKLIYRP